jgi:predicted nucleic acid-binding protein
LRSQLLLEVDAGEAAAIAYCIEHDTDKLLIDDGDGRRAATDRKINVIGTVGVLLIAKEAGLLPLLQPHLAALKNIQFYISDKLFRQALQLAGEL